MPKPKIENLLTQMHDAFGDNTPSPEVARLMQKVQEQMHDWDQPEPPEPSMLDTAEMLLAEIESEHPQAAAIMLKIIETLNNIGV